MQMTMQKYCGVFRTCSILQRGCREMIRLFTCVLPDVQVSKADVFKNKIKIYNTYKVSLFLQDFFSVINRYDLIFINLSLNLSIIISSRCQIILLFGIQN